MGKQAEGLAGLLAGMLAEMVTSEDGMLVMQFKEAEERAAEELHNELCEKFGLKVGETDEEFEKNDKILKEEHGLELHHILTPTEKGMASMLIAAKNDFTEFVGGRRVVLDGEKQEIHLINFTVKPGGMEAIKAGMEKRK